MERLAGLISKENLLHEIFVLAGTKSRPPIGHKANLGRKWSDDYKQKMSSVTKGIKKSQKHKNNISKSNSKKWLITTPNGDNIHIINLENYCKENNLQSSKMSLVAAGIRKHHKKYTCVKIG